MKVCIALTSRLRVAVLIALLGGASACERLVDSPLAPTLAELAKLPQSNRHIVVADTFAGPRYIIRFKDGVQDHHQLTASLVGTYGGHLIHTYDSVFKGFNAVFPNEQVIEALRRNPNVQYAVPAGEMSINTSETSPGWGLDRIDRHSGLDNVFNYFQGGAGVNIYVIDSGITGSHSEFTGRTGNLTFTSVAPYDAYQDCVGHGTFVASVAAGTQAGVAKGATINSLQVVDCSTEKAQDGDIVAAIDFVVQYGTRPAVINLSLGRKAHWYTTEPVDDAVRRAISAGYHVVISAGNDGADACEYSPAHTTEAVTVAASNSSDGRASNLIWASNYGSCVDLFAPGQGVRGASTSGGFITGDGTSFAAPYVTGTLALILSELPNLTPAGGQNMLKQTSTTGHLSNIGTGSPNRLLYSPHTLLYPISGPESLGNYPGTRTWSVSTIGGDGSYTYGWVVDYDDPDVDDEYPSTTSDTLTWYIDNTKGSFTIYTSVVTYGEAQQTSLHVTVAS